MSAVPTSWTRARIMFAEAIATFRASCRRGEGMASGESSGCHRGSSVKVGMFAAFSSASIVCMEVVRSPRREVNGVSCDVAMVIELMRRLEARVTVSELLCERETPGFGVRTIPDSTHIHSGRHE